MYYNGRVLSLWGYLAQLLYRSHQSDVFSSSTISQSPHLAFLLLRFIECSTFVRDSTTSAAGRNIRVATMLKNLGNIIEAPDIAPELKARAMAMRLLEQYIWRKNEVTDIWGNPVGEQEKQRTLDESERAINILERVWGHSCVLVYLTRIRVEYGTINIKNPTWDKVMAQERLFDRDDLYGSCWFFAFMTKHAIDFTDREALVRIIPAINEAKSLALGEWDRIFQRQLGNLESWKFYQECAATLKPQKEEPTSAGAAAKLQTPSVPNPQKNISPGQSSGDAIAKAVVNEVIKDTIINYLL